LHATKKDTAWVECDGKVGHELRNDHSPASVTVLPQILEAGVPVMLFAGAEDLICNAWGIRKICDTLKWDGLLGMGVSLFFLRGASVGRP
jgi:carboxypeptidase D